MLVYIWVCVMMQAFVPGGARFADHQVHALQAHVRAQIETIEDAITPPPVISAPRRVTRAPRVAVAGAGFAR